MPDSVKTIYMPRPLINRILAHAQQHPDTEVCGLIGGDGENAVDYYAIDNIAANPHCRFLMDAPQQIKAMKQMRDRQQTLFAVVHSHPTTPAEPSQLDIDESSYRDVYYLIISLNTRGVLQMRAYSQQQDSMKEVELLLQDDQT
jgi:[CysO sulfur-carrier protein]-S-L-cysteine hydrolase